ncbi:MAG: oligosaccharide flippase family protein, partial [Clostridia bacterium]|nr:oligosaccharide flippase family protein [Clostridia bacterium]
MQKTKNSLIGGATVLGLGAFISKLLGAVYRVPLTNALGGVGLGLYQMVFPVYCLLLDFSGAGVPNALSKLIATGREEEREVRAKNYLKNS